MNNKYPKPATREKRLTNFIIDSMAFAIIYTGIIFLLLAIYISFNLEYEFEIDFTGPLFLVFYFFYYFISEVFSGRTIGKLITGTKVVHLNDIEKQVKPGQILVRSLIRLVPIEFLSFLTNDPVGWHDNASNTIVINIKELRENEK